MKYEIHPSLFLRAPFYSFRDYDLHYLPEILQHAVFRFAIELASPAFYKVLQTKAFRYELLSEKEIHTLRKYYNRMSFRATPFGCFATVSVLNWMDAEEAVCLTDDSGVRATVTTAWAVTKAQDQKRDGQLFVNPLLYRLGPSWRYVAAESGSKGIYNFSLQELDAVRLNNNLLKKAWKGIDANELTKWIAGQTGAAIGEASDYIRYLTDEQVLVKDPGKYLISPADGLLKNTGPVKSLNLIDLTDAENTGPIYPLLCRPLVSGGPGPVTGLKLAEAIQGLSAISTMAAEPALAAFINAFSRRFDRQRVPLMEALDPDLGVSFDGGDLLAVDVGEDSNLKTTGESPAKTVTGWSPLHRLLFSMWTPGAGSKEVQPIRLTSAQLAGIQKKSGALPPTLSVLFRTTTEGVFIDGVSGASATQLIGRFSLLNEGALQQGEAMAEHEVRCNPDVVFADISHWSDEHVDNINRRSQLYPFEICLNTISALPQDMQIRPEDLLLSVRKGELILESKRLKKRVIPRLSTAYNFKRSRLPVFNLLCTLQYQGLKAIKVPALEQLFPGLVVYPRLYLDDVIVAPAKWIFKEAQLRLLTDGWQNDSGKVLTDFRRNWSLPALISLGETDQQLVFDLSDPLDSTCFLKEIAGKDAAVIREYLVSDKTIRAGGSPLAGQYLAYLIHPEKIYRPAETATKMNSRAKRYFQPGSEWLYLQIFCTPYAAGRILSDVVAPVVARIQMVLKTWFFIRYDEGGNHLRLRFKLNPSDHARILTGLNSRLHITGLQSLVQNMRAETYRPELERYPFFLMPKIEKIFEAGSDLILRLPVQDGQAGELVTGLVTIRIMLEHFGCDLPYIIGLSLKISDAFIEETGRAKQARIELDALFRQRKAEISQALLATGQGRESLWRSLAGSAAAIGDMAGLSDAGRERLIADLIHMQLNRTFSERQRLQEMTVWYCLYKYLKGQQAQANSILIQDREDESNKGVILRKNASR